MRPKYESRHVCVCNWHVPEKAGRLRDSAGLLTVLLPKPCAGCAICVVMSLHQSRKARVGFAGDASAATKDPFALVGLGVTYYIYL